MIKQKKGEKNEKTTNRGFAVYKNSETESS
jgi:hypothetical protein